MTVGASVEVVVLLVRAEASLFLAMSRSSGESFFVVVEDGVVDGTSSLILSSGGAAVVVAAVVVVTGVEGDRPKMGILGLRGRTMPFVVVVVVAAAVVVVGAAVEVVLGLVGVTKARDSDGLSASSSGPGTFLAEGTSSSASAWSCS